MSKSTASVGETDRPRGPTLDPDEVARFSRIAAEWWDPKGKFRPLHQIGPPRLAFIREHVCRHFKLDSGALRPLGGLNVLDIGCGGGLIAEPLTRLGARVTAIDPAERNIAIAKEHAGPQGLQIDYRVARVEDVAAAGETFDLVTCLEVVEHVPDVAAFIAECAKVVRPGGLAVFSTINRTMKAWALAIVGAEYVLRLAAARHASMGPLRDAGGTRTPLDGRGSRGAAVRRHGLQSADGRLVA